MSTTTLSLLDQAELLQLALNASAANDSGTAIAYLKEATSRPDATAIAHYILGAEYAQSKLYERAAVEMGKAVEIDPGLSIARLQLGLLWLSGAAADKAVEVLTPLMDLSETDPLRLFGKGLCHLIKDEFIDATECLQNGIKLNETNPALNSDMQKILNEIVVVLNKAETPQVMVAEAPKEGEEEEDGQHVLLSAYTRGTSH